MQKCIAVIGVIKSYKGNIYAGEIDKTSGLREKEKIKAGRRCYQESEQVGHTKCGEVKAMR